MGAIFARRPRHVTLDHCCNLGAGPAAPAGEPVLPGGGDNWRSRSPRWANGESAITGFDVQDGEPRHPLGGCPGPPTGPIEAAVDPVFRQLMRELHTDLHIVNALVFQSFDGALVTGVQMNEDGTARIDFDLPEADNDRLRALEPAINDVIRQDLRVRDASYASARPAPRRA